MHKPLQPFLRTILLKVLASGVCSDSEGIWASDDISSVVEGPTCTYMFVIHSPFFCVDSVDEFWEKTPVSLKSN